MRLVEEIKNLDLWIELMNYSSVTLNFDALSFGLSQKLLIKLFDLILLYTMGDFC